MSLRVAYCTFPNSEKEYSYLCPFEEAKVGDRATVQSGTVTIKRLSRHFDDSRATKSLICIERPDPSVRKKQIEDRLLQIERLHALAVRFKAIAAKDPEAKRLVAEYKKLCK